MPARLPLFVAASLALTLTPGPAVLFIVARSLGQGRRSGLLSVAGIGLGNAVHAVATALGLAALLASSPLAFSVVRWLGAGYLVLLGARKLLGDGPAALAPDAGAPAGRAVVRQAFTVAVLNPKTALFFLAFLPQFADPRAGALPAQILLLGAIFVGVAVATDTIYAFVAGGVGAWLGRHPGFGRAERWVSGIVYVGLGVAAELSGAVA
jgi:threonine/homoserine/homoserine lactone efflux protein